MRKEQRKTFKFTEKTEKVSQNAKKLNKKCKDVKTNYTLSLKYG